MRTHYAVDSYFQNSLLLNRYRFNGISKSFLHSGAFLMASSGQHGTQFRAHNSHMDSHQGPQIALEALGGDNNMRLLGLTPI